MGPENVNGSDKFWSQKLMLLVRVWGHKLALWAGDTFCAEGLDNIKTL
jgi:hypothetical protein